MGTNCAPLLADNFLYSYEADFKQSLLSTGKTVSISVQSHLQVHRWCIVHKQPRIRKLPGPDSSCWTWDQGHHREHHFCFLSKFISAIGRDGQLHTSIYDKRDDFIFHITNFPFLSSNIPSSPAFGVFISQLIRYALVCSSHEYFILRARRLSSKLLKQGYLVERLKNRHLGSFMVDTGALSSNIKSPLTNVKWHSDPWLTVISQPIRFPPILWPWYRTWPSPNYEFL